MHTHHPYLATKRPRRRFACDRLLDSSPLHSRGSLPRVCHNLLSIVPDRDGWGMLGQGIAPEMGGVAQDGDGLWRSMSSRGRIFP